MRVAINFFLLLFALNCFAASYYSDNHLFASEKNASRYEKFLVETRCVVCQNQNLMDSAAPLANDLREKIYSLIKQDKSDIEIKSYLTKRYGQFILLQPEVTPKTAILWAFPFLGVLIGLCIPVYFFTKKNY